MSASAPGPEPMPDIRERPDAETRHMGIVGLLPDVWPRADSGLEIRGGGAVAVDTETLRSASARFLEAGAELDAIGERLGSLNHMVWRAGASAGDADVSVWALCTRLVETRREAERIAGALQEAAIAYELVELNAEHRAAVMSGDTARAAVIDARVTLLSDAHPAAWTTARGAEFERSVMWPSELVRQATETGVVIGGEIGDPGAIGGGVVAGAVTLATAATLGIGGWGRLSRDAKLGGAAGAVALTPVVPVRASGAPRTLTDVTERMPGAGDSRVRVERYAMPNGTTQFAVYIAGTQSLAYGGDDPWDNRSNLALYTGSRSESYAVTEQALAAAGAEPGDAVHLFGHSQGAMIAAHLALEGDYDTQTLVSFGSPVSADVGPGILSVTLRHTDDPAAALDGGGHFSAVGAPGSFVAERVADTETGFGDLGVPAHRMTAYAETAALVDASSDPRVGGLHEVLAALGRAESVEVAEYAAARVAEPVSPSRGAAG